MVYTTQMLGLVPMTVDGTVLRSAIIWMDGRAPEQAKRLMRKFLGPRVFAAVAGAELSGKDGLPKLLWLKENEPDVYGRMDLFLDVNGYLSYRSTGQMALDWSSASAFALDLKSKEWMRGIVSYMGIDMAKFPPLIRSIDQAGTLTAEAAEACGLLEGTPLFGGCGDAPGAAVGSGAVGEGEGHIYLGTSGWVGVVTEKTPTGRHGVVCIQSADPEKVMLFSEMETAGACLKWIADEFYRHEQADPSIPNVFALMDRDVERIPPGSDYLVFTPWMYGERSPVADTFVRSTFFNMSADHSREHLLRAVYEGVAYNLRWMISIVEDKFGFPVPELRAIGGGARGAPWMQIIADVTGRRVKTIANPQEAGAVGAALAAGVGLGMYPDFESLRRVVRVEREFEPQFENGAVYDELYAAYRRIYRQLRGLYHDVNQVRFREG
jgi:xylulokinase